MIKYLYMYETREHKVAQFHKAFHVSVDQPPSIELLELRKKLITEEVNELVYEIDTALRYLQEGSEVPKEVWVNMLKEMADVQVVLSGTAVSLAPVSRLEEAFLKVHHSNMTKLGLDGQPIFREDGKVLKGPNYQPADLNDLVA